MKLILAIAVGGALGALSRYGISMLCLKFLGYNFPYGTLIVNMLGSFIIGFLGFYFAGKSFFSSEWQAFVNIGFLGALTTFSTFSLQTFELFKQNAGFLATINVFLNVGLCLIAVSIGAVIGRMTF